MSKVENMAHAMSTVRVSNDKTLYETNLERAEKVINMVSNDSDIKTTAKALIDCIRSGAGDVEIWEMCDDLEGLL